METTMEFFSGFTSAVVNGTMFESDIGYSPQVAFDFIVVGTNDGKPVILNDFAMDWVEFVWSAYFAVYFGLLGSTLERFSLFVYSCNLFGFYLAWTQMRDNPVFMDPVIFDQIMRVLLAAGMSSFMLRLFKVDSIMQAWTTVTIATGYLMNLFDSTLREHGGCDKELGPPSEHFALGVWKNCDDWTFAYSITWAYAGTAYVVVFITGLFGMLASKSPTLLKYYSYAAVAMTATSAAVAAMRSGVRLCIANDISPFNDASLLNYTDYVFWGLMVFFIVAQECIQRWIARSTGCIGCIYKAVFCFACPMYLGEKFLIWVENKALEFNKEEETVGETAGATDDMVGEVQLAGAKVLPL